MLAQYHTKKYLSDLNFPGTLLLPLNFKSTLTRLNLVCSTKKTKTRTHELVQIGGVSYESPDPERSNPMGIVRKTMNVFKNSRFCGKRKDCTRQLTSILKR